MNKLFSIIKSPNIKAAITIILSIAVTAIFGTMFGLSLLFIVGISLFILLIGIIILMFKKMKNIQKAGEIEKSIGSNIQMNNLSPQKRAEIEQFKKQLEAAINSLKNSKIGKGKTGKAALYALPWYMIIGPPGAGKTTAVKNSGLDFPFGKEGFKGVGSTRNCDWFFSTKAIFLDTAGRYVTQEEDRAEWVSFLEVLKKNRSRKPINGVIAALNIDEIINSDKAKLSVHAGNIRQRVDELIEKLEINVPVYFVFTKCDLIQGFVEYYGDLSELERSQVWGATLNPQQLTLSNATDMFEDEFKILEDKLLEIRTIRLSSPLKREQRRKVFLFPFQFNSLKEKLSFLISEVFQHNPYQDNPIFRGFYFTSGTQEGNPLDIAIKEIAKQFNLPASPEEEAEKTTETKHYFIKDLVNDILLGDRHFSPGRSSGFVKRTAKARLVTYAASLIFIVVFCLLAYFGYNGSYSALENISNVSASFSKINWDRNLLTNFKEEDNLRSLINKIENGEANESFISFGMDRTAQTLPAVKELYLKKTELFFIQNIYNHIHQNLNRYANGEDNANAYNYLKAYLLLTTERSRIDTTERRFLSTLFNGILESNYVAASPLALNKDKDSLRILFKNYINFVADMISDKNVYAVKNDNLLISIVRDRIQFKPNAEGIYARLKQKGISQFPNDISIAEIAGGSYSQVIRTDSRIPYLFTADGLRDYVQFAIEEESINPGKDDWVLGKTNIRSVGEDYNSDKMKKDLLQLYFNDYKQTWIQFMQSIRYSDFGTVPLAANNLKILADPSGSPLIVLLKEFGAQINIIADILSSKDSSQKSAAVRGKDLLPEINKYVKFVLGSGDGSNSGLNSIIAQYGVLSGVLESIKEGQDLVKDYAVKVLNQRTPEFSSALQTVKGAVYNIQPLQNLFLEPVRQSWRAILSDAAQYVNLQWKVKVADVFNKNMANSFPFKNGSNDVPIQDFKDFFKPQDGILWSFFNEELSAFINKERMKVTYWENEGINISNQMISALKKADEISSTFYKDGDLNVFFRLKPQLPESKTIAGQKPIPEQVYLYLDGIENYYKMGAPFWTDYNWPGAKGTPGAKLNISIRGIGNSETKVYDGEWALFRLLNEASISKGENQFAVNWFFKKENQYDITVIYHLSTITSRNPFSKNFFEGFSLPNKIN